MISDWRVFPSPESRTSRATESGETCSDHGFPWIPQNNSCIFPQLRAACERTCTAWRIMSPPTTPSVLLVKVSASARRHADHHNQTQQTPHLQISPNTSEHLQELSATRTHATAASNHAIISYLFKTPNTFAHIFTNACFHRPQLGDQVERSGVRMGGPKIREISGGERRCSGQLQRRTTEWLRSGWCRPSHILRGFLKQITQTTTRLSHSYTTETYNGLNVRSGWKTAITENHFPPTFSGLIILLSVRKLS